MELPSSIQCWCWLKNIASLMYAIFSLRNCINALTSFIMILCVFSLLLSSVPVSLCRCVCYRVFLSSTCWNHAEINHTKMQCFTFLLQFFVAYLLFFAIFWCSSRFLFFSFSLWLWPKFLIAVKTDRNEFNMCVLNEYTCILNEYVYFCCARRTRKKRYNWCFLLN